MGNRLRIAGAGACLASVLGLAACGSGGAITLKAVKLAAAYRTGELHRYSMKMTMDGTTGAAGQAFPIASTIIATETTKVSSVDPDGVATVDMTIDNMSGTTNGKAMPTSAFKTMSTQVRIAKDGTVVGGTGIGSLITGSQAGASFGDQVSALLPDHEVRPGDKWTKTVSQKNPMGTGQITAVTTSTYLRDETANNHNDAVIESRATVPLDTTVDFAKVMGAMGGSGSAMPPAMAAQFKGVTVLEKGTVSTVNTSFLDIAGKQFDKMTMVSDMNLTMTYQGLPPGSPLAGQPTTSKIKMIMDLSRLS